MSQFGLFLLMFAALCGLVALIRALAWLTDVREAGGPRAYLQQRSGRYIVSTNAEQPVSVMSRSDDEDSRLGASVSQTDGQADRQTAAPAPIGRDIMLDICRDLRAHGYSRDGARVLLRKLGQSLDNNVWSDAAPPTKAATVEDDTLITPYAGRRTKASYYPDDPALEYQAPTT